ncbi:MAG: hypothetical protein V4490_05110 [Pseudomonadota bacterium]
MLKATAAPNFPKKLLHDIHTNKIDKVNGLPYLTSDQFLSYVGCASLEIMLPVELNWLNKVIEQKRLQNMTHISNTECLTISGKTFWARLDYDIQRDQTTLTLSYNNPGAGPLDLKNPSLIAQIALNRQPACQATAIREPVTPQPTTPQPATPQPATRFVRLPALTVRKALLMTVRGPITHWRKIFKTARRAHEIRYPADLSSPIPTGEADDLLYEHSQPRVWQLTKPGRTDDRAPPTPDSPYKPRPAAIKTGAKDILAEPERKTAKGVRFTLV